MRAALKRRFARIYESISELHEKIDAMQSATTLDERRTPATVRSLLERLDVLEAGQRETEDIRALSADRQKARQEYQEIDKALIRSIIGATFRMRKRRSRR